MCGITGFLTRTAAGPDAVACVTGMTRTLNHRGPDSEGTWVDHAAGVALGHRRLAVVDLSCAGNQPMISASGRYVIVFNGEIYNFLDLRRQLESVCGDGALGFDGHSDTEVMLACFERWGVANSVARFNGMFAFAVWDRLERRLHLARDPLGEKPLYYGLTSDTLLFGSELKALRAHPAFQGTIDRGVLALYLDCGYVPAPYSIYKKVLKLSPGTILTIKASSWLKEITSYWSLKDTVERGCANPFQGSDHEAERQLESLLLDVIKIRMVADVPLGAFLSGGIDSSLVVALMQSLTSKRVKTFTIGFHESEYNEAPAAKAVASHLHTEHTEWYVTAAEARAVVPRLPALYDEPFADSSQIPTFLVSALARKQVTVSLSGDGGDELFGGYERYSRISRRRRMLASLPRPMRSLLAKALTELTREGVGPVRSLMLNSLSAEKLQKLAAVAPLTDPTAFYAANVRNWHSVAALVRGASEPSILRAISDERPSCDDFIHHMMAVDTATYLPDDILVKIDRASMGVSLESRVPLLDPRVVEFAWRLPLRVKMRGGQTKRILRQILYKYVPRTLVERPKSGFAIPVGAWIRGPLREWAEELLDAKRIDREGYFASEPIRRRWTDHLAARHDHSGLLWFVLMFQAWIENESNNGSSARLTFPARDQMAMLTRSGGAD
jgi:asparagine synthase (glutamine-hydrolysing)